MILALLLHTMVQWGDLQTATTSTRLSQTLLAGTVEATSQSQLQTNRMARVVDIAVREGAQVAKGDLVIRLRDEAVLSEIAALQASIQSQENALQHATTQRERLERLEVKGAASKVQVEQASLVASHSQAQLQAMKAQLAQLTEQQEFLELRSSVAGQVVRLSVSVGAMAQPGQVLAEITNTDARNIRVMVPARLHRSLSDAQWFVSTDSNEWHPTQIQAVSETPQPQGATYTIYLESTPVLQPFQRVIIKLLQPHSGVFVPQTAIERRGQLSYVYANYDGKPMRRLVRTGYEFDGWVEVVSGLNEGESYMDGVSHE
ncbi:MAG: efflux RND transporter periplasmic adaptor subunit [Acidobacteria bacterium]|nr:efflux RND transporter periplasmic adaptor subunit [Acidobacteriota bacterium]